MLALSSDNRDYVIYAPIEIIEQIALSCQVARFNRPMVALESPDA
jgi:hypothetical protein